jgi:hypothetical protein
MEEWVHGLEQTNCNRENGVKNVGPLKASDLVIFLYISTVGNLWLLTL